MANQTSVCRALLPSMTGKATDLSNSAQLAVDILDHLDHLPCDLLIILVVLLPLVLDVAKSAFDSQRVFECEHYRHPAFCRDSFEHLDVLVLLLGPFLFAGGREWLE